MAILANSRVPEHSNMKSNFSIFNSLGICLTAALWFVPAAQSFGEENKQLILLTDPPTPIELTGDVTIDPLGNIVAVPLHPLECGSQACEDVQVATQAFSVNNVSSGTVEIEQGTNAVFRWSSRGAWQCEGSGLPGWGGRNDLVPANTSGLAVTTATVALGSYPSSITCRNGASNEDLRGPITVAIIEAQTAPPPPPSSCGDYRTLPTNWTRLTTGSLSCRFIAGWGFDPVADCRRWDRVWPAQFPSSGNPQRVGIGRASPREYIAMEFSVPNLSPSDRGDILWEGPGGGLQPTERIATISSCQGNFDRDAVMAENGCYFVISNIFDRVRYGGVASGSQCVLDPNKTYFFNLLHSSSPAGTAPSLIEPNCPTGTQCGALYDAY